MRLRHFCIVIVSILTTALYSQDPQRFAKEVSDINAKYENFTDSPIVFTGSSSIRMWQNIQTDCNSTDIINSGFGGSHMSDLLFYIDDLIIKYNPRTIYIYEGDNDIAAGKTTEEIITTTVEVINRLQKAFPNAPIYFISAKPSIARWEFEKEYIEFNEALKSLCLKTDNVNYLDVWTPMLNEKNLPEPSIFIDDNLHMNQKGYDIWKEVICSKWSK